MPRPNRPRDVFAEANLARRIATERDARGWTNDSLASRMTAAGCAMTGSAIFKIEKGDPPRRIVVDELVAFAKVFGVSVEDLLLPPEVAARRELADLVVAWNTANAQANSAISARDDAWDALKGYVEQHPEAASSGWLESIFSTWAEWNYDDEARAVQTALQMWRLTHDDKWAAIIKADIEGPAGSNRG